MVVSVMNNFRNPKGVLGSAIVSMMNLGHRPMTKQVIAKLGIQRGDNVLDIGCGGGMALALMAERGAIVHGIDYSEVCVRKARKKNRTAIAEGRVTVTLTGVDEMEFSEGAFDLVTAFETIYFWENIRDNFVAAYRVLKPGGRFAVALEAYRENGQAVNCPAAFSNLELRLYSPEELCLMMAVAGFDHMDSIRNRPGGWICVHGTKPVKGPAH